MTNRSLCQQSLRNPVTHSPGRHSTTVSGEWEAHSLLQYATCMQRAQRLSSALRIPHSAHTAAPPLVAMELDRTGQGKVLIPAFFSVEEGMVFFFAGERAASRQMVAVQAQSRRKLAPVTCFRLRTRP